MKSRTILFLLGAFVLALIGYGLTTSPPFSYFVNRISTGHAHRRTIAAGMSVTPNLSGQPCAARPGSAYPNEGSGNCRGNLMISINLPTAGLSLIYNSQSIQNLGYGVGWTLSADSFFEMASPTTGTLYLGEGTPVQFTQTNGVWSANFPILFPYTFTINGGTLKVSRPDGSYDIYWVTTQDLNRFVLSQKVSRLGYDFLFSRNLANLGAIQSITNLFSQVVSFSYSGTGNLSSISDYAKNLYGITIDGSNNLTQVTYPDGSTTKFVYASGTSYLNTLTDPYGRISYYTYFGSAPGSALATTTDFQGFETVFNYTPTSVSMTGFAEILDEVFSAAGTNLIINTTENGVSISGTYDNQMRLLAATDYFKNTTSFTYAGNSPHPLTVTNPDGTVLTYGYDANNFLLTKRQAKGANGIITTFVRDPYENLSSVSSNNVATQYAYDSQGNITQVTDPTGSLFLATYSYGIPTTLTNLQGYSTTAGVGYGMVWQISLPTGEQIARIPSSLDQTLSLSSNFGVISNYSYDPLGRTTNANSATINGPSALTDVVVTTYSQGGTTGASTPTYSTTNDWHGYCGTATMGTTQTVDLLGRTMSETETTYQ